MSVRYTVALSEPGNWRIYYIDTDGKCRSDAAASKPLTMPEARLVKRLFLEAASKDGRKIRCKIERLP